MLNDIYRGKKIFLTGHTGFKGGWLALWLKELGAEVCGYSLSPETTPNLYDILKLETQMHSIIGDIRNREKLEKSMLDFQPDMVFHLAAQPLVRLSYFEPVMTYESNVIGTLNVLESARKCQHVKVFVNITTDKCYENKEVERSYKEDEPMGGHDIYSSSKACAEILSSSYRRSFLQDSKPFALATTRAGNVIGGGDWALDRLVPDCIRCINNNEKITIRNPIAVRPWQHVLEPLSGYLLLGKKLFDDGIKYAEGYNFGPKAEGVLKVAELAQKVAEYYGQGEVIVEKKDDLHEAGLLMLNIEKAEKMLGWIPSYTTNQAIVKLVDWYKAFYTGQENMLDFTLNQIKDYESNIAWKKN